ncbi:hypothetical protein JCM16418A_36880 [Paenibacillus pini]
MSFDPHAEMLAASAKDMQMVSVFLNMMVPSKGKSIFVIMIESFRPDRKERNIARVDKG